MLYYCDHIALAFAIAVSAAVPAAVVVVAQGHAEDHDGCDIQADSR